MSDTHSEYLQLLAQADLLQLVSCLLDQPHQSILEQWNIDPADRQELIRTSGLPDQAGLIQAFSELSDVIAHADLAQWTDEHCRLFEAVVVCPINESAYIRRDKGTILSDICGFYGAFGFLLEAKAGEKADHMIGELQFFSLLLVMAADALREGEEEKSHITLDALSSFAQEHLGEWIFIFCDRLGSMTGLTLYQRVAMFLARLYKAVSDRLGIPPHDPLAILETEPDTETPYECGMSEACGSGQKCDP